MKITPDEPRNGDFAAYVDAIVKQAGRAHAAQRLEEASPAKPRKSARPAQPNPAVAAKPNSPNAAAAQAAAQSVLHAASEESAQQAVSRIKGWVIKGAIGLFALTVVLPMFLAWWDRTDDPSSAGVLIVLAVIALRWWLTKRG